MKKTITMFLMSALILGCVNETKTNTPAFKSGDLLKDVSEDPFGTPLTYAEGEPLSLIHI